MGFLGKDILVLVESPYAGDVQENVRYARSCMQDCFERGEYPFASHLLYPQVLDDFNLAERELGILAGLAWGKHADRTVVYEDLGISGGMRWGIDAANEAGRPVFYRKLGGEWDG